MIDPKIESAIEAALSAFSEFNDFDATTLVPEFNNVFASDADFLSKVDALDTIFDDNSGIEVLREIFFDMVLINFFSEDVKKLEEDYLDTPEWESIEEQTLDRGTELLNLLLYLNECDDESIEPSLEDYLKEFLLVDEDEFQDEYYIYEPVIENQALIESPVEEISQAAQDLTEDTEIAALFYPMMCFFQNPEPTDEEWGEIADYSVEPDFDMAVLEILLTFN